MLRLKAIFRLPAANHHRQGAIQENSTTGPAESYTKRQTLRVGSLELQRQGSGSRTSSVVISMAAFRLR